MKKKIISLFLSIALLVAACSVMAACGEEQTTTAPVVTTTSATTTVPAVTTQIALNSALDFNNGESCIALLNKATYNKDVVAVEVEEDAIVIYSKKNYDKDADKAADFEVTFDLSDNMITSGYGTYAGRPWYVTENATWNGTHQYMTISFKPVDTAVKDATKTYFHLVFTFEDGKTATIDIQTNGKTADANGNIVLTLDLVKELASSLTTDKMPTSTWGTVKNVKSVTINALGADYKKSTDTSSSFVTYKPEAGDSITINHIVFSADYDAAVKYGTDAE